MFRSSRLVIVTFAVAVAAAGVLNAAPTAPATSIGAALSTTRAEDRAARATEPVRYDGTALALVASYPVRDGHLAAPTAEARHGELWALVLATLPDDAVALVRQLNVVTDGHDATLAMVHRSSIDATTWVLSIDPAERDDVIVSTLVHEYAHMLTLRRDDLSSAASTSESCAGVRMAIGCARPGSILADWYTRFWATNQAPPGRQFVSDYAATNPHEDLAESFLAWVLDEVEDPSPAIQARYDALASHRELVTARDAIRAKLAR